MDALVFTVKETAEILHCSEQNVRNMRSNGILRALKGRPIRFSRKDVLSLVGAQDSMLSPLEARRLKIENERLQEEVERLRSMIRNICAAGNLAVVELDKGGE